jgi:aryl-alcohol dehydrogenase-like predicted oxidoreductase
LDPGPGKAQDDDSLAALGRAFELGVNLVVTSDAYGQGHSEILVGKAIKSSPRRVHVATQVGLVRREPEPLRQDFSPDYIRTACDRSLNRLGVTCVDLYLLQHPSREVLADERVWDVLRELKDGGSIAHFGVAAADAEDGLLAIEKGDVAAVEVRYNLSDRTAAQELFSKAEKKGVGILVREPLAGGLLTGRFTEDQELPENDTRRRRYSETQLRNAFEKARLASELACEGRTAVQVALKFALASVAVNSVTVGVRNAEQAAEVFTTAVVPDLTPEDLARCAG